MTGNLTQNTNALKAGHICDATLISETLGISKDRVTGIGAIQGYGEASEEFIDVADDYIGDKRLFHTFYREKEEEPFRYVGLCERGGHVNRHPKAAKKSFIISAYRGSNFEELLFNIDMVKAVARFLVSSEGVIPIVPHLHFTRFLNDENELERNFGIEAGHELMRMCDEAILVVVGGRISEGMKADLEYATTALGLNPIRLDFTRDEAANLIKNAGIVQAESMETINSEGDKDAKRKAGDKHR